MSKTGHRDVCVAIGSPWKGLQAPSSNHYPYKYRQNDDTRHTHSRQSTNMKLLTFLLVVFVAAVLAQEEAKKTTKRGAVGYGYGYGGYGLGGYGGYYGGGYPYYSSYYSPVVTKVSYGIGHGGYYGGYYPYYGGYHGYGGYGGYGGYYDW
ncbi:uncharacterized protein LOC657328 isoform X1 [Tribolium castaneum]